MRFVWRRAFPSMETTVTDPHLADFRLRMVASRDAAAVAKLSGQLGYEASAEEIAERIQALLSGPKDHVAFVACLGDEVVGWIEASLVHHLQSPVHSLISGLVVKDGVRSLGVGRRLHRSGRS